MPTPLSAYLRSNVLVHIVEGHESSVAALTDVVNAIAAGTVSASTSELSWAEVLVAPLRDGDTERVGSFERLLSGNAAIALLPITQSQLRRSAALRAELGCKLPDAIHAAAAETRGCSVVLSEDRRFRAPSAIKVHTIESFAQELRAPLRNPESHE